LVVEADVMEYNDEAVHKADEARFSVRFNPADPRHRLAMEILNRAGRRKAFLIADAVCSYFGIKDSADIGISLGLVQSNTECQSLSASDSCAKAEQRLPDCSQMQPENSGAMFQGLATVLQGLATVLENLPAGSQNSVDVVSATSDNLLFSTLLKQLQSPKNSRCNSSPELESVDWVNVVMTQTGVNESDESELPEIVLERHSQAEARLDD
jgi:hypothetical protein